MSGHHGHRSLAWMAALSAFVACSPAQDVQMGPDAGDGDGDASSSGEGDGDGDTTGSSGGSTSPSGGTSSESTGGSGETTGDGDAPGTGGAPPVVSSGSSAIPLPYIEDFEDGLADGWIADVDDDLEALGSWSIVEDGGSQVFQETTVTDDPSWAVGGDYGWTDQRLEAKFKFLSGIEDGIIFVAVRLANFDYYYYLEIAAEDIELRIRNDGNEDILEWENPTPILLGEWHTIALSAVGTTVSVELDGMEVMSVTDARLSSGGVGLAVRDATAAFDDITVTAE